MACRGNNKSTARPPVHVVVAVPIGNTNECAFLNGDTMDPQAANHPTHRRPTSSRKPGQRRRLLSTQSVGAKRCGSKITSTQPLMDCAGTQRFRRAAECVVTCLRRSQCHLLLLPLTTQSWCRVSNVILPISHLRKDHELWPFCPKSERPKRESSKN
jgi:hypothetical protein